MPGNSDSRRTEVWGVVASLVAHLVVGVALFVGFRSVHPVTPVGSPPMVVELMPVPAAPAMARETAPTPNLPTPVRPRPKVRDELTTALKKQAVAPVVVPQLEKASPIGTITPTPESPPNPRTETQPTLAQPPAAAATPDTPKAVSAAPVQGANSVIALSAEQSWQSQVLAQIEKKKRYPGPALRAGQQDVVNAHIWIDRTGHIVRVAIESSKHFELLDAAAMEAIQHSDPFPRPPDSVMGDPIEIIVDIDFFFRSP